MSFHSPSARQIFVTDAARRVTTQPVIAAQAASTPLRREHVLRGPGLPGALARGLFIAALVMGPALVLPGLEPETAHLVVLLALFAGALTAFEYASPYPGLLEFRFGAPYNRTRFFFVLLVALLLALLQRHASDPGPLTAVAAGLAGVLGPLLSGVPNPVALLAAVLPEGVSEAERALVRDGAALAFTLGALLLAGFGGAMRLGFWPLKARPFNVWINLPSFEPTAGRDVVARLRRLGRINLALGLALPLLLPGVVLASTILMQPISLTSPLGFVWGIVLWVYLPVSLIMRGMALMRVAGLIDARRARVGLNA